MASLVFACEDPGKTEIVTAIPQEPAFEGYAELIKGHTSLFADDPLQIRIEMQGTGISNLLNDFVLSLSHLEDHFEGKSKYRIKDGRFVFSDMSGDKLKGTYSGSGISRLGENEMSLKLIVETGEGSYEGFQGILFAELNDYNQDGSYDIYISGDVR